MKDGGPAFACAAENGHQPGMSLRDYFAAAALQGILAAGTVWTNIARDQGQSGPALAYAYADAMLAEREKS